MTKLFHYLFITNILCYSLLSPSLLLLQQIYIQTHIESQESLNTIKIILPKNEYTKSLLSNKKEIKIHNKLYDILSAQILNGHTVELLLQADTEEEEILLNLTQLLKHLKKSNSSAFSINLFFTSVSFKPFAYSKIIRYFLKNSTRLSVVVLDKISPPPKFCY